MLAWSQLEACRKPNAGVVAACSEEGSCLVRAQAVLPNRLMNTPRKPFTGPEPGRPAHFSAEKCFELSKGRVLPSSVSLYRNNWCRFSFPLEIRSDTDYPREATPIIPESKPGDGRDGRRLSRVYLVEPPLPWHRACQSHPGLVPGMGATSVALSRNVGPAGDGRSVGNNRPRSWMACGRRCTVASPAVQRTGSRSFPIASASSLSRAVVVVRHAKRRSDTGIPGVGSSFRARMMN